jgi:hypothetical protein
MGAGGMTTKSAKAGRGKIAVLGGLGMILVAVCVRLVRPSPDAGIAAAPFAVPVGTPAVESAASARPATPLNVIAWPKTAARDPFRSMKIYPPPVVRVEVPATAPVAPPKPPPPPPVNVAALARETLHLKGTVQGERSLAMVNDRLYRAGQTVNGFRIVEIGKRTVTVEKAGVRVVIEPD